MKELKLLFVCIGNTCRSPMAQSVMKHWIEENDLEWEVDSAALRSWNVGRKPEDRCVKVLAENGLTIEHLGRMITSEDFCKYDYIFGMDNNNVSELKLLAEEVGEECIAKVELFGKYIGRTEDEEIQDPYFSSGIGGFRCAFSQITDCSRNFIKQQMQI